jgi:CheY-specific phosphatase CheX
MESNPIDAFERAVIVAFSESLVSNDLDPGEVKVKELECYDDSNRHTIVALMKVTDGDIKGFFQLSIKSLTGDLDELSILLEALNQIAGRLSNQLYRQGVKLELSPPTAMQLGRLKKLVKEPEDALSLKVVSSNLDGWLKLVLGPKQLMMSLEDRDNKMQVLKEETLIFFED